ncbi:MAG: glycosyltransferase N-terminal domain-containing protein [Pseudomonadota bacterium]
MSPLLRLYLAFSAVSEPIWRRVHKRRLACGKEIADRLPEKYGNYAVRPEATRILWFHALSIGESFALLPLIERALADLPDTEVVLTTSTASSIEALDKAALPDRCRHILLPVDTPRATRAFLDHWRPALACFAELDFWPRLMWETHRRDIPMVLVNSRMPDRSFERRRKLGPMMRDVLRLFDCLLIQDDLSRDRFVQLGAEPTKTEVVGALKAAARPLPADEAALTDLENAIGDRPVWCAAATERSEHAAMMAAHEIVTQGLDHPLLILAPRFREDGNEAEALARQSFTQVARRSLGQPLTRETQVYIADTFGEMGLWYRLAPISFIGHSLAPGLEGKNPFEAAALGSSIVTGPNVSYFLESFDALYTEEACREIRDAAELGAAIVQLQDTDLQAKMREGAARVVVGRASVLDRTWEVLRTRLDA